VWRPIITRRSRKAADNKIIRIRAVMGLSLLKAGRIMPVMIKRANDKGRGLKDEG
jgi:hypothetical protein